MYADWWERARNCWRARVPGEPDALAARHPAAHHCQLHDVARSARFSGLLHRGGAQDPVGVRQEHHGQEERDGQVENMHRWVQGLWSFWNREDIPGPSRGGGKGPFFLTIKSCKQEVEDRDQDKDGSYEPRDQMKDRTDKLRDQKKDETSPWTKGGKKWISKGPKRRMKEVLDICG